MSKHRLSAYIYLLAASIIWGVAVPIIKYTLYNFPPLIFLVYRFWISASIGVGILFLTRPKLPKDPLTMLNVGVISILTTTIALGLLFVGVERTTSMSTNVLGAITPLLTAVAGVIFLKEHMSRLEKIGATIAVLGTLLSVVEPVLASEGNVLYATITGNVIIFISLLIGVVTTILTKILLRKAIEPAALTTIVFIIGFITTVPLALSQYSLMQIFTTIAHAPLIAHLGVIYMAVFSGTLAYFFSYKGMKSIEVGEASIFAYLMPIWGAPLSVFWLGEKISGPFIIGAVLIAIGVFVAEYKKGNRAGAST
jgi:drug/metabolite transporter (DMT)-like permease